MVLKAKSFTMPLTILLVIAISHGSAAGAGDYYADLDVPYGDAFLVTELRTFLTDDPSETPPDCDNDDVDLYENMVSYNVRNMDIYYPKGGASSRKVVFFVHGGGWEGGYKEWYSFVPTVFTGEKGWVTVVVNYRLVSDETFKAETCPTRESCEGENAPDPWGKAGIPPQYTENSKASWYPDNLDDVADAFAWVLSHIGESPYFGNPDELFLLGHSAGAHLVSLLAVHPDYAHLRPMMRGVVSMSGLYQLDHLNPASYADMLDQLFKGCGHKGELPCSKTVLDEASPLFYIESGVTPPPFLVIYSEVELPDMTAQAVVFEDALSDGGHDVTGVYLSGFTHVTEMMAVEYTSDNEPVTASTGEPGSCMEDFGPNPKPERYRNPTDRIIAWIESKSPTLVPEPGNGIWKTPEGLSFYVQKYETGSSVVVFTLDGVEFAAFLDENVADGIDVSNDVGGRGYSLTFTPSDSENGWMSVSSGAGSFSGSVVLQFPSLAEAPSGFTPPADGIWKSDDGVASYLQNYEGESCILLLTLDGVNFTAFHDPYCGDGVSANNDVGGRGYSMSLELDDAEHGRLLATGAAGETARDISLLFAAAP